MKEVELNHKHSWTLKVSVPFLRVIAYSLCFLFAAPIRVWSNRNVKKQGSLLIISNHLSNIDPIIVQFASPRLIHFLSRKELFDMGLLGKIVKWFGSIPIKQSAPDKGALKKAIELLKLGECVGIFPEGQLSPDGKLIELFSGTALIIKMAQTPCLCVGIQNTHKMMPNPKVTPQWAFSTIKAKWGEVKNFAPDESPEAIMAWIDSELRRLSEQD